MKEKALPLLNGAERKSIKRRFYEKDDYFDFIKIAPLYPINIDAFACVVSFINIR